MPETPGLFRVKIAATAKFTVKGLEPERMIAPAPLSNSRCRKVRSQML